MCPSDRLLPPSTAARSNIRSAFDVIDSDHDGKISCDDLRAFYAGASPSLPAFVGEGEDVIGAMIAAADSNRNGFVEYEEFEQVLKGFDGKVIGQAKSRGDLVEEMFKVMDKDGDGRLSYGDLKSYMDWAGFGADDEEIKAMMRLAGGDEVEGISFGGLLNVFGRFQ